MPRPSVFRPFSGTIVLNSADGMTATVALDRNVAGRNRAEITRETLGRVMLMQPKGRLFSGGRVEGDAVVRDGRLLVARVAVCARELPGFVPD